MKYTFLMPAYKASFLRDAIQSLLNQTYRDFQLIVSDDCSPEGLKEIVDEFDDERIIYRRNLKNTGAEQLIEHWNLLLGLADTEYVVLSPDDDMYSPTFLEEIDKLTIKYPAVNILKSRSQLVNAEGEPFKKDMLYEEVISQFENIYHQALGNHISGIGNYVFKNEALRGIGGFVYYPYAWWSDVMTTIKLSNNGMAVTREILFHFRQSDQNISSTNSKLSERRAKANATFKFYEESNDILSNIPIRTLYEQKCKDAWNWYMQGWRWYSLKEAAKSYKLKEIHNIMKANRDIFSSKYYKYVFFKLWLLP